ncbi:MAG: ABC transporter ATP-binding protein, partial [Treponema sp.]|nr:ABC transporter ATP-binding protein [Treponema sp.]
MKINTVFATTGRLYHLFSPRHRIYLLILLMLTIGLSLIETIGISAIMPFISAASNPGLLDSGWYKKAFDLFKFERKETFIVYFGITIIAFYIFRAVYSVIHTYLINRFSQAIRKSFSRKLFAAFLKIPYRLFAQKNSGELTQIIVSETNNMSSLSLNILQLCTELFTILLVYSVMIIINWKMTLLLTAGLAILVLIFLRIIIKKNKVLGAKRIEHDRKVYRILRETFGNFKFVRLKGNEKKLINSYDVSINGSAKTQVTSSTLGIMPKSVLESLGFSLLVGAVILILTIYRDASKVIPLISMYALALYRILPSIHRMLGNVNNIAYVQHAINIIDENLHQPSETEGDSPLDFQKEIRLENITFAYTRGGNVINNISLEIRKGEKIAITGESGGGKSTLVDLVTGIHQPAEGHIYIDSQLLSSENVRAWRKKIGYIPQNIYLFDGTVAENVSFGSEA